jgi:2-C-methyl-D-erythritol 4-phosphate cytidylyltransferase
LSREVSTQVAAIVVAAGSGERMGADRPKALVDVAGQPMLVWSVAALAASARIASLVIVAPAEHIIEMIACVPDVDLPVSVVAGGATRAESVACGLEVVPADATTVLVHDAARPLITPEIVTAVLDGIGDADGAIAATPLVDTPKVVDAERVIRTSPERSTLWLAQTPQAFRAAALRAAVEAAVSSGRLDAATDCASLVEANGGRVRVVPVATPNLKLTHPIDLIVAEQLLSARPTQTPPPR